MLVTIIGVLCTFLFSQFNNIISFFYNININPKAILCIFIFLIIIIFYNLRQRNIMYFGLIELVSATILLFLNISVYDSLEKHIVYQLILMIPIIFLFIRGIDDVKQGDKILKEAKNPRNS